MNTSHPSPHCRPSARRLRCSAACLLTATTAVLGGCTAFGPELVARDRVAFTSAIGDSQSQQLLLNLLRMRDGDAPVFLDVVSVRTEYSLARTASIDPLNINFDGDGRIGLGAGVERVDEPRITYRPLSGRDFATTMFSPVPAESIMLLTEGRRDTDWILLACVERINGLRNDGSATGKFARIAGALHDMQQDGELAFRVHERDDVREATVTFSPTALARLQVLEVLDLDPARPTYAVSSSPMRECPTSIAIQTRSIATIMQHLADRATIEVRPMASPLQELDLESLASGETTGDAASAPNAPRLGPVTRTPGMRPDPNLQLRLQRFDERPADAGVAVEHRGHWYAIHRSDRASRAALSLLQQLIVIQDSDSDDIVPVIRLDE